MAKKPKAKLTAEQVIAALADGPLRKPAHVWLCEVRNQTGYSRSDRRADALVISAWPSRGIWMAGIEVKVSRSDWKHELDQPKKSHEIQRFCDFWYIAAAEGVVDPAEVPTTWGFYEVAATGKRPVTLVKPAPKLTPEPLTATFVASVLRNQADSSDAIRKAGHSEGWQAAREHFGGTDSVASQYEASLRTANGKLAITERERDAYKAEAAGIRATVEEFERESGVTGLIFNRGWKAGTSVAELYRVAQTLKHYGGATRMAETFEQLANDLRLAVPEE